ncbi:MAG: hypothetical protein A3F67_09160 [Verrucomicrobia bacterium RIFCSPHIGHO2_12_FULL_41_10]|nr:MAG: hypothetical protein A3F67_09160 [Verrucomicrobia bacterium RIFCSPHIGHO2_12_FULL_41_10]
MKLKKQFLFCLLLLSVLINGSCALLVGERSITSTLQKTIPVSKKCSQLIVITTADWNSTLGTATLFERFPKESSWKKIADSFPVVLGKNGLAWGLGLHGDAPEEGLLKVEGDGRSPAGVFILGESFGYAPANKVGIKNIPYRQLTETDEGVDDPASRYYNRIVAAEMISDHDWNSFETMLRPDGLYRLGLIIQHNWENIPGRGSCIFMHLWRSPDQGTAGCTAMASIHLEQILHWLDSKKNPLLVQLPFSEYDARKQSWHLP